MWSCSAEVDIEVEAAPARTFAVIVPIDLAAIFTGYGMLPAVLGTQQQTGAWDAAGQTRTVLLADGSRAREHLTHYDYPQHFAYTVSSFTSALRFLTSGAHGEWWFRPSDAADRTLVRWRYTFTPRSAIVAPLMGAITTLLWRGYMRKALRLCKAQVEHPSA